LQVAVGEASKPPGQASDEPTQESWIVHCDPERGFSVRYPKEWYLADERLTPNLGDPREILSVGTYRLRVGGERCAHFPVYALEDLGSDDAFISVFERSPPLSRSGLSTPT
jgi:hypothetical protein